jgi:regulator of PEP synthase PpsR (kinase-PPPase family)
MLRRSNVRTAPAVRKVVEQAARMGAVVFYTLVGEETRQEMTSAATEFLVPAVDILGPSFSALHDLFKAEPSSVPGLLYTSDREHFDRLDAIDYTLKHDDGQHPNGLPDAHVVVVGVSRASKSSTCFFLAYEGIRAANVPLIADIPPPRQLLDLDPERVVGLRMNVMRLQTVREVRAHALRLGSTDGYTDKREIAREVRHAHALMDKQGWPSFDASYMAIEEIAKKVLRLRGLR